MINADDINGVDAERGTLAQKSLEVCKQHRPCMSCIGTSILMRQKGIWMEMLVETSKSRDQYQSGNFEDLHVARIFFRHPRLSPTSKFSCCKANCFAFKACGTQFDPEPGRRLVSHARPLHKPIMHGHCIRQTRSARNTVYLDLYQKTPDIAFAASAVVYALMTWQLSMPPSGALHGLMARHAELLPRDLSNKNLNTQNL